MSWVYEQSNGNLTDPSGKIIGVGFSGNGTGMNNPSMQSVHNIGPLPQGNYTKGIELNKPNTGPFSIPLIPDPNNNMFGRGSFYMHGSAPNIDRFGYVEVNGLKEPVSDGCICMGREIREIFYNSPDNILVVIL